LQRFGLAHFGIFNANGRRLEPREAGYYAKGRTVERRA
jgi:hypothetical protein